MTGPGSRWSIGRIALNRCVPTVAPAVDRRSGLVVGRLGVPDRGHHARVDELLDRRQGPVALRRDGDHADRAVAGAQHRVDLGGIGVPHQGRLVGTAPQRRQPRTLQVDPVESGRPGRRGQRLDLPQQVGGAGGDQRRDQGGGAVPAVQRPPRSAVSAGSAAGEVRTAAAVHVGVDEARHHRRRAEIHGQAGRAQARRRPRRSCRRRPQSTRAATVLGRSARCRRSAAPQMPCQSGLER